MENGNHGVGGGVTVNRRAEIDTSPPFRSVKEAVSLFGERVLAGEVYAAGKIKEMNNSNGPSHETTYHPNYGRRQHQVTSSELEETKRDLEKAREETKQMSNHLTSLQEELERTKKELQELKEVEAGSHDRQQKYYSPDQQIMMDLEIDEDLKYVEADNNHNQQRQQMPSPLLNNNSTNVEDLARSGHKVMTMNLGISEDDVDGDEFQKKRYVSFANQPLSEMLFVNQGGRRGGGFGGFGSTGHGHGPVLERHPSLKKKKKKPLIPLIGGIFGKKKNSTSSSGYNKYASSRLSP